MSMNDIISMGLQSIVALAAIFAASIAVQISKRDRRHSRLLTELEYAVRLHENKARGGSTDKLERARLGAQALALAAAVGPRWVPAQFERAASGMSREQMRNVVNDESVEQWVRDKAEAALAVMGIFDEIYSVDAEPPRKWWQFWRARPAID